MPREARNRYSIRVVEHALDLLEVFSEERGDLGVSQLSDRLGMHKSRVFKLLATLEQRGYVERGQVAGSYRSGLTAYETGRKLLRQVELLRIARPAMDYLAETCNEAAYLAMADREGFLMLDKVEPAQRVQISPLVGKHFPSQRFIPGRTVLSLGYALRPAAAAGADVAREIFLDRGVLGEGVFSLILPLLAGDGGVRGGLCLVAPEFRAAREESTMKFIAQLRAAGEILAAKLHYNN